MCQAYDAEARFVMDLERAAHAEHERGLHSELPGRWCLLCRDEQRRGSSADCGKPSEVIGGIGILENLRKSAT